MILDPMGRLQRMSRLVPRGPELLEFLDSGPMRAKLMEAALVGQVPAAAISQDLLAEFGRESLSSETAKQFCGSAIAAILRKEGFAPGKRGVRVRGDELFTTGRTYTRFTSTEEPGPNPLLRKLLDTLDDAEARWALRYLSERVRKEIRDPEI